ncbi:MAG: DinB family protein [Gemmatimonadales bacterium]
MKSSPRATVVSVLAAVLAVMAPTGPARGQATRPRADHAVPTVRSVWQPIAGYIAQSAEDMPEDKYGYKPTPEVRSFGQLIAHVAGSQYMYCAAATGDSARSEDAIEKTRTTKSELIAALRESTEYCGKAYSQSDASTRRSITMFGQKQTRLWALMSNAAHDDEHYGNIVTYLRLNGMVPPSSKGP